MCLPSDALLQHLPSYLGFSYLGCGVSLHGCSSKAQPLLLTLYEGYLLTTALPDLQCGMAPLGPPAPTQPRLLGCGVGPPGHRPWPRTCDCSSPPRPLALGLEAWGSSSRLPPLCVYIYIYVCVCVCVCVCVSSFINIPPCPVSKLLVFGCVGLFLSCTGRIFTCVYLDSYVHLLLSEVRI